MIIFFARYIEVDQVRLEGDESFHCQKVLRKKIGDEIFYTDGVGSLFKGEISHLDRHQVLITPKGLIEKQIKPHQRAVAICPTKNLDRFEWFVEKATEIGVTDIYPMITQHTEKPKIKVERCEKKMVSAMKQSKNLYLPKLHPLSNFDEVIKTTTHFKHRFIAHCHQDDLPLISLLYPGHENALVLIGPEGDFSLEEVEIAEEAGFKAISLGGPRLRTETAGIIAAHFLNL